MTLKHFSWVLYMILCHAGPPWGLFKSPLGPCKTLKRPQGGPIWHMFQGHLESCRDILGHEESFWVIKALHWSTILGHEGPFWVIKGYLVLFWAISGPLLRYQLKTVFGDQLNGLRTSWLGGEGPPWAKIWKEMHFVFWNFLIWAAITEISVKNGFWGPVEWVGDQLTGWGGATRNQNSKINAPRFLKFFDSSDHYWDIS